jgi:hypothetical protein
VGARVGARARAKKTYVISYPFHRVAAVGSKVGCEVGGRARTRPHAMSIASRRRGLSRREHPAVRCPTAHARRRGVRDKNAMMERPGDPFPHRAVAVS